MCVYVCVRVRACMYFYWSFAFCSKRSRICWFSYVWDGSKWANLSCVKFSCFSTFFCRWAKLWDLSDDDEDDSNCTIYTLGTRGWTIARAATEQTTGGTTTTTTTSSSSSWGFFFAPFSSFLPLGLSQKTEKESSCVGLVVCEPSSILAVGGCSRMEDDNEFVEKRESRSFL